MTFADAEARTAASVMGRLANATATPLFGDEVSVVFDRATIETLGGDITGEGPVALAQSADVTDWVSHETVITINGDDYTLRDKRPDGTGMTLLILEARP